MIGSRGPCSLIHSQHPSQSPSPQGQTEELFSDVTKKNFEKLDGLFWIVVTRCDYNMKIEDKCLYGADMVLNSDLAL